MGLRKWAIAALLALVMLSMMTPATAWIGSERVVNLGDMIFGTEFLIQRPSATLFHTQDLATTDNEALAIGFPVDSTGQSVSPSIAQAVDATSAATSSGFFKANYCYIAPINPGGYALTSDISTWQPMKSSQMVGSGISWPWMNNAPLYGEGTNTLRFKPAITEAPDTSDTSLKAPTVGAGNAAFTGGNLSAVPTVSQPATGASAATSAIQTPNRDYKNKTTVDIKNMSGLEKMYRNSNLRNTIPQTFKGSVSHPTTIDALKQPMDVIKPANKPQVIKDSLNMTQPGKNLKTLFWDL